MNPVPPRSSPSTARAVVLVAALALLWGSNFLWIKVGLEGLSPVQLTVGRLALGALVLLPLLAVRGERLPRDRAVWGHLVMAALLANAAPYLLFAVGEQSVDSALAGVLNATTPLWTVAVALLARHQRRLSVAQGAGLVLGFVGVVVILGVGTGDRIDVAGALACLAASASYGLSYVYISRYLTGRGLPPLVLSTGQLLGATALLALVVPVAGLQPVSLSWAVVGAMVALGPLGTGLAFVIN
ncbi:MAG: DMT family transporter, partial [Pseudonocardia sp.]|nr:DMT family transporter [Pseudonocardia sp.]